MLQRSAIAVATASLCLITSTANSRLTSTSLNGEFGTRRARISGSVNTGHLYLADSPIAQARQLPNETVDGLPLTARFPDTMEFQSFASGEGIGIFFSFKPENDALDNAEVQVFLPAGTTSISDHESQITGPNGLMESNRWRVSTSFDNGVRPFPYSWVTKVLNFSSEVGQVGHLLLGKVEGQVVQVILLYPPEQAFSFWADAIAVLESFEFDPESLPIPAPSV